jgi:Flp pilus assembly protein TadG
MRGKEGQAMFRDDGALAPTHQRGAAGIEFALIFPLLFALFYAVVGYGLTMTLIESMTNAASEGSRVALAVDWQNACPPPTDSTCIQAAVTDVVRDSVGEQLAWLPPTMKTAVLGADNGNVQVLIEEGSTLVVVLEHPDFANNGFVPVIQLPLLGNVPAVPAVLTVEARVSLGSPAV